MYNECPFRKGFWKYIGWKKHEKLIGYVMYVYTGWYHNTGDNTTRFFYAVCSVTSKAYTNITKIASVISLLIFIYGTYDINGDINT